MTVVINGTSGITDVNGTAAAPAITGTDTDTGVFFGTNTVSLSTGGTERVTLDANGQLGIGATSMTNVSNYKFVVTNAATGGGLVCQQAGTDKFAVYNAGNDGYYDVTSNHIFRTGGAISGTERARISSGGRFSIGTTSNQYPLYVNLSSDTGDWFARFQNNVASQPYGLFMQYSAAAPNGLSSAFLQCTDSAQTRLIIYSNGTVNNWTGGYAAFSDIKLKENIVDTTPKLEKLMQVRIRNYNLIGDDTKMLGVVAQELESVFPNMIDELPDYEEVTTTDEEGNEQTERVATGTTTKSVKYSIFVPMLIKAMQEQQAIITQLQADVAALKAKA